MTQIHGAFYLNKTDLRGKNLTESVPVVNKRGCDGQARMADVNPGEMRRTEQSKRTVRSLRPYLPMEAGNVDSGGDSPMGVAL